tara:strand:- start:4863 stop:5315 length:453 start_codon:yes stop_codon:yes gene_type:complete
MATGVIKTGVVTSVPREVMTLTGVVSGEISEKERAGLLSRAVNSGLDVFDVTRKYTFTFAKSDNTTFSHEETVTIQIEGAFTANPPSGTDFDSKVLEETKIDPGTLNVEYIVGVVDGKFYDAIKMSEACVGGSEKDKKYKEHCADANATL